MQTLDILAITAGVVALLFIIRAIRRPRALLPPIGLLLVAIGVLLRDDGMVRTDVEDRRTAAAPARPNVILILVDTLRADRTGWHGGGRALTPFLDGLAAQSAVFLRAYAASSWTAPSLASLFTSRYPTQHGQNHQGAALPHHVETLAGVLTNGGYSTMAILGHGGLTPAQGLTRGFDVSHWVSGPARPLPKAQAAQVNADTLAALERLSPDARARPLFLYLHFMEPHLPYEAPDELVEQVLREAPNQAMARAAVAAVRDKDTARALFERMQAATAASAPAPEQDTLRLGLEILYDAEVADRQLEQLFAGLRQRGLLEDALVVLTADHGEEFYEHGTYGHGTALYEETLHVPLLMWRSTRQQAVRVDVVVSLIDVAPTVLDVVGLPVPPSFVGRSLAPALAGRPGTDTASAEPAFSEVYPLMASADRQAPTRAVIRDSHKLIVRADGSELVFDLRADPGERAPLADAAERTALRRALDDFVARVAPDGAASGTTPLDAATRERLRALGYVP